MDDSNVTRMVEELRSLGVQVRRVAGLRDVPDSLQMHAPAGLTQELAKQVAEVVARAGYTERAEGLWGDEATDQATVERWVELRRSDQRWEAEQREDEGEQS